jgi:hypothetical protein
MHMGFLFQKIENTLLGLTIMFCPISDNVPIMWVCYVCGLICEVGVHIPKPKKSMAHVDKKALLLSNNLISTLNLSVK